MIGQKERPQWKIGVSWGEVAILTRTYLMAESPEEHWYLDVGDVRVKASRFLQDWTIKIQRRHGLIKWLRFTIRECVVSSVSRDEAFQEAINLVSASTAELALVKRSMLIATVEGENE